MFERVIRDIVSINDLNKEEILKFLELSAIIEKYDEKEKLEILKGKVVSTLFFEPSTRTKLSFEAAASKMGADVLRFPEILANSSLVKGESLSDTLRMVDGYSDLLIIRHFLDGAAKYASTVCTKPIINAGDGSNQHPSQTLLDLYTILKYKEQLNNLKIAFVGDLKYGRTVHSLTEAISMFNPTIYFVSPDNLKIPKEILGELNHKNIKYEVLVNYRDILSEIDVFYMTRIQKERFADIEDYEKVKGVYQINKKNIVGKCKNDMIIMHPLPRVTEINTDLDDTKYAAYFEQAKNGIPVRQAMMAVLLHEDNINIKL